MTRLATLARMALAVVLFLLCMSVVGVRTLGMTTFVVTGSSMEPTIHKGSLVVVEPVAPTAIRLGNVITFDHYDQVTTHRVIALDLGDASRPVFTTKGDANAVADPEPVRFTERVGLVRVAIPLAGYAIAYIQGYWRFALSLAAAAVFFWSAAQLLLRREPRRAAPRPVLVAAIDPEELWQSHVGWLRERTAAELTQVA